MAQDILQYASASKAFSDIKSALANVGCDICDVDDLSDVAGAIKDQLVTGPNSVVNAEILGGNGIKVTPIARKGYKIEANDQALITGDISKDIVKGETIHKALFEIANKIIPAAMDEAAKAPSILGVDFVKIPMDGCDYYPLRNQYGSGRKTGLRPADWYLRIILTSQSEPMYINMGNVVAEIKHDTVEEMQHYVDHRLGDAAGEVLKRIGYVIDKKVDDAIDEVIRKNREWHDHIEDMHIHEHIHGYLHHKPNKPGCPDSIPPFCPPGTSIPGPDFDSGMNWPPAPGPIHGGHVPPHHHPCPFPPLDVEKPEEKPEEKPGCDCDNCNPSPERPVDPVPPTIPDSDNNCDLCPQNDDDFENIINSLNA